MTGPCTWVRRRRALRAWQRELDATWNVGYEILARFNRDRAHGKTFDPALADAMAAIQRDFNERYVPLLERMPR